MPPVRQRRSSGRASSPERREGNGHQHDEDDEAHRGTSSNSASSPDVPMSRQRLAASISMETSDRGMTIASSKAKGRQPIIFLMREHAGDRHPLQTTARTASPG